MSAVHSYLVSRYCLKCLECKLCQGEIPFWFLAVFTILKNLFLLYLCQILTKLVTYFSYVITGLFLKFPLLQNILFWWGIGLILLKDPFSTKTVKSVFIGHFCTKLHNLFFDGFKKLILIFLLLQNSLFREGTALFP